MTRGEFDVWIEQHYGELLAVAKERVKWDAEDALQSAVAGMLASSTFADTPIALAWPWAVAFIRYNARNMRVSEQRRRGFIRDAKIILPAAPIQGGRTKPAPGSDNPTGGDQ